MALVELDGITKSYGSVVALDRVSLTIASGEFFTLLGPSGCGKTTLLRTVAGFHRQDQGSIRVGGEAIDDVPAYRRDIGMVFQDYAVFPHMTVEGNVAFGLKNRRCGRSEIKQRVARALELVRLSAHATRMPHQLSGGQQQRVGLARAMVINPKILLMDEPLSNLDAKLRIELREDIRDLQRSLGTTTIYVTHDQEEALVVSDRICVMHDGQVHQIGTPWEIYKRPATLFVAGFVGAMNLLDPLPDGLARRLAARPGRPPRIVGIRPEDVVLETDGAAGGDAYLLEGTVAKISFAGREALYFVDTALGIPFQVQVHRPTPALLGRTGQPVRLRLPDAHLLPYDEAGHVIAEAVG
ncbi:MAG TPA: ABC transporter ATP-binding protein [Geminicoccaceae bacterium]|nr:ABC transporter ATP-binding protein [Geminicoccaceae bacterium]